MKRVIQEHIKRPLADDLLFGELAEGGEVRVELAAEGGRLTVSARARRDPQKALPASTEN